MSSFTLLLTEALERAISQTPVMKRTFLNKGFPVTEVNKFNQAQSRHVIPVFLNNSKV